MESLFVATFALLGLRLGANRISDNSMFVHIRTGIEMAAGKGIPRTDPFSFTAHGEPWVVQSWLPSMTYGWLHRWGGMGWVALEQGVLLAILAWLVVRLARTGTALRTLVSGGLAIGVGMGYWSPRPLLFGLIAFALLITVVERRINPWWLVPVVWFWVNSHGSFPLGLLWLGAVAVGGGVDGRRWPTEYARYAMTFGVGLAVAAINPLGPRLLWFPLTVGDKREIFRTVVEWRSPDFQQLGGLIALACISVGLLLLLRTRVIWRDVVPVIGFLALGLLSLRNIPALAVVMAPALARALAAPGAEEAGRPRINAMIAAVLAVAFLGFGGAAAAGPGIDVSGYPVRATTWLERNGYLAEPHRIAQQDTVGCYFDLRYGRRARVFIDDRVDMFPLHVSRDYATLLEGKPDVFKVLDRHRIDAVVWGSNQPLVTILKASGQWRQVLRSGGWTVLVR